VGFNVALGFILSALVFGTYWANLAHWPGWKRRHCLPRRRPVIEPGNEWDESDG